MADTSATCSPSLSHPAPLSGPTPNVPTVAGTPSYPVPLCPTAPPSPWRTPTGGEACPASCMVPAEERRLRDLLRHDVYGPRTHPRYTFPSSFSSCSLRRFDRLRRHRPTDTSDESAPSPLPPSLLLSSGEDALHPLVVAPLAAPHPPSSHASVAYERTKRLTRRLLHQRDREAVQAQIQHLRQTFLHGVLLSSSMSNASYVAHSGPPFPPSSQEDGLFSEGNRTLLCSAFPHFSHSPLSSPPDDAECHVLHGASPSHVPTMATVRDSGHLLDPIVWIEGERAVGQMPSDASALESDPKAAGTDDHPQYDDRPTGEADRDGPPVAPQTWKEDERDRVWWPASVSVLVRPLMDEVLLQRVRWERDWSREEGKGENFLQSGVVAVGCGSPPSVATQWECGEGSTANDALSSPSAPFISCSMASFPPSGGSSRHYREWQRQEAIQRAVGKSAQEALIDLQVDQRYRQPGQFLRRQHRVR